MFKIHQPDKFIEYYTLYNGNNNKVGFTLLNENKYYYDDNGGWCDYNGCYYDCDGKPQGYLIVNGDYVEQYDMDAIKVTEDKLTKYRWLNKQQFECVQAGCLTQLDRIQKLGGWKCNSIRIN